MTCMRLCDFEVSGRHSPECTEEVVAYATINAKLDGITLDPEWCKRLAELASGAVTAAALVAEEIARIRKQLTP